MRPAVRGRRATGSRPWFQTTGGLLIMLILILFNLICPLLVLVLVLILVLDHSFSAPASVPALTLCFLGLGTGVRPSNTLHHIPPNTRPLRTQGADRAGTPSPWSVSTVLAVCCQRCRQGTPGSSSRPRVCPGLAAREPSPTVSRGRGPRTRSWQEGATAMATGWALRQGGSYPAFRAG